MTRCMLNLNKLLAEPGIDSRLRQIMCVKINSECRFQIHFSDGNKLWYSATIAMSEVTTSWQDRNYYYYYQ